VESLKHVFIPATGQSTLGETLSNSQVAEALPRRPNSVQKYSVIPGFDGASETGRSARLRIRGHFRPNQYIIKTKKTYNLDKKTLSISI
jgi:hypothetical protein